MKTDFLGHNSYTPFLLLGFNSLIVVVRFNY